MESITKTAQNAATYVQESISGTSATASKEANKQEAKNSNAGVGERLSAAGSAIGDKADEQKSEANKESAKQNL